MKRLIPLLLLLCGVVYAQEGRGGLVHPLPIEYPGGEDGRTAKFYRKLSDLVNYGQGDVSIVQIGGSHIQAGWWSGRLRNSFLSMRYGLDGGRGLVFPFSAAQTNTPQSYRSVVAGTWTWNRCMDHVDGIGATGMIATACDTSATFLIDLDREKRDPWEPSFMIRSIDLLGDGSMEPYVVVGRDTLAAASCDYVHGVRHYELPHYTSWFKVIFEGPGKDFTVRGLWLDRPGSGLSWSGLGVNGAATGSWTSCTWFKDDLALVRPDLVIFCIGINDIQDTEFRRERFMSNHRELIRRIRAVSPDCALLFLSLTDSYYRRRHPNELAVEAEKATRDLAKEYKAGYWNLFEVMGGLGSVEKWNAAGLANSDLVHFTKGGYYLMGDLLFKAIRTDWAEHDK